MNAFGALHQRLSLLVSSGILTPLPFDEAIWIDEDLEFGSTPAQAGVTFYVNRDGTWHRQNRSPSLDQEEDGNWAIDPAPTRGDNYSVKYTLTQTSGGTSYLTITNEATTWEVISTPRAVEVLIDIPPVGADTCDFTLLVEIRDNITMQIVSATVALTVSANQEV